MNGRQRQQLTDYLEDARDLSNTASINHWSKRVQTFLTEAMGADVADRFRKIRSGDEYDDLAYRVGQIEGLIAKGDDTLVLQHEDLLTRKEAGRHVRKVFVVHGHDGEAKETVARFLEKLELEPIIPSRAAKPRSHRNREI
jgi:hypothetical protein